MKIQALVIKCRSKLQLMKAKCFYLKHREGLNRLERMNKRTNNELIR